MKPHANLSFISRAVLNGVYAHHRADADTLQAYVPGKTRGHLRDCLRHLIESGWLESGWTDTGTRVWFFAPRARTAWIRSNVCLDVVDLVPPRRTNVMAGHYTPAAFVPARRGAMDFATVASRGHSC